MNQEINHNKKNWTLKILTIENLGLTKYPQEKHLESRNTHEKKFWTGDSPTRKHFRPTKTKKSNPRNNHEKKFETHEITTKT